MTPADVLRQMSPAAQPTEKFLSRLWDGSLIETVVIQAPQEEGEEVEGDDSEGGEGPRGGGGARRPRKTVAGSPRAKNGGVG